MPRKKKKRNTQALTVLLSQPKKKVQKLKQQQTRQVTLLGKGVGLKKFNGKYYSFYSTATDKKIAEVYKALASVGGRYYVRVQPYKAKGWYAKGKKPRYIIWRKPKHRR